MTVPIRNKNRRNTMYQRIAHNLKRLLPQDELLGNQPFIHLVHLLWLVPPLMFEGVGLVHVSSTLIAILCFLPLYFVCFWKRNLSLVPWSSGLVAIGFFLAPFNFSSSVFVIYACTFTVNFDKLTHGLIYVAAILVLSTGYVFWADISVIFLFSSIIFGLISAFANIHYYKVAATNRELKQSREEIQQLAKTAERERIARDLHDLMGHTFSMITVKAQLAQKLYQAGHSSIEQELVDIETLSRQALSEVRQTVDNYKLRDLAQEVEQAARLLAAAQFSYTLPEQILSLPAELDSVLAFAVREGVTNCIKHSQNSDCIVELVQDQEHVCLTIDNSGHYEDLSYGNGLKGLQTRLEAVDGAINIEHNSVGFNVSIKIPITQRQR